MRDTASAGPYDALRSKAIKQGIRFEGNESGPYFDGTQVYLYVLVFDRERGQKVVRLIDVPPEDIILRVDRNTRPFHLKGQVKGQALDLQGCIVTVYRGEKHVNL